MTGRVNQHVLRSEAVRGVRRSPLATAVFRPFWHGHGADALWHLRLIFVMRTERGLLLPVERAARHVCHLVPQKAIFAPVRVGLGRCRQPM